MVRFDESTGEGTSRTRAWLVWWRHLTVVLAILWAVLLFILLTAPESNTSSVSTYLGVTPPLTAVAAPRASEAAVRATPSRGTDGVARATSEAPSRSSTDAGVDAERRGPAIVILVANELEDYRKIVTAITSVDENLRDDRRTPLLLFNEGDLPPARQAWLRNLTDRPVHFPTVDFQSFPPGFDPAVRGGWLKRSNRWGYMQMCRFWITGIWDHPVTAAYSTYLRMDTDSCFTGPIPAGNDAVLPGLPAGAVYAPHLEEHFVSKTHRLLEHTQQYLRDTNHTPLHTKMWQTVLAWQTRGTALPSFYNNFEVTRVDFFRQPRVAAYQRHVTERPPHGVFVHRWGDAPVRYLTVALFARPDQLVRGLNKQYGHSNTCHYLWKRWRDFPCEDCDDRRRPTA